MEYQLFEKLFLKLEKKLDCSSSAYCKIIREIINYIILFGWILVILFIW